MNDQPAVLTERREDHGRRVTLAELDAIEADCPAHARAARAIDEEHFDAWKVVGRIVAESGLG